MSDDGIGTKTYVLHFEGDLEIQADTDEEAIDTLWEQVSKADIGYYRIYESKPDSLEEIRLIEEY